MSATHIAIASDDSIPERRAIWSHLAACVPRRSMTRSKSNMRFRLLKLGMKAILLITRERQRASSIHHRHAARPARRRCFDLDRKAGDLEAERRQLVEVGELFHVAVADLAAGFVAFP